MPIIDAYKSKQVVVMKRGMGSGYADIPNPMFFSVRVPVSLSLDDGNKTEANPKYTAKYQDVVWRRETILRCNKGRLRCHQVASRYTCTYCASKIAATSICSTFLMCSI